MEEKPLVRDRLTKILKSKIEPLQTNRPVRIPSERDLANEFRVSRLSIRSALKQLIHDGILTQKQGSGTYIQPRLKTGIITFVISPELKPTDPFYNSLFGEITRYVAKNSIPIAINQAPNKISANNDSPIVVIGLQNKNYLKSLIMKYKKVIIIQHNPGFPDTCQIYFDNYAIGHQAAEILLKNGHRRLVHLTGPDEYSSARQRRRGFTDALAGADANLIIKSGHMNWNSGYHLGKELVETIKEKKITAAFMANDWMAIGFYQRLKEHGINIPDDISIIGCDDIPMAREIEPKLFTFSIDPKKIITSLFKRVAAWPSTTEEANRHIVLQADVIKQGSVKNSLRKKIGEINER